MTAQQAFYAQGSRNVRLGPLATEVVSIAAAAAVPIVSAAGDTGVLPALFGGIAAPATGLRQAF